MRGNFGVGERGWSAARQHAARLDDDGCVSDSGVQREWAKDGVSTSPTRRTGPGRAPCVQCELAKAGVSTNLADTPEVEEPRPTLRCSRTPVEREATDRERTDIGRDR